MRNRSLVPLAALVLGIVLASADESAAQGRTVTVTGANGKSATATTTVDSDASDGTVGAQRTIIGFNGKTASSTAGKTVENGTVQRQFSRTGFGGRTSSRQSIYNEQGSSHARTTRSGKTYARSRQR
jgi:hypothetical protein